MEEREGKRCNMENGEHRGLNGVVEWVKGVKKVTFFPMQRCQVGPSSCRARRIVGGRDGRMNENLKDD